MACTPKLLRSTPWSPLLLPSAHMPGSELSICSFMCWLPSVRQKHALRLMFEVVICDMSVINWSHYKGNDKLERLDSHQASHIGSM